MTQPSRGACAVCGEAVSKSDSSLCGECDRPFHLNQRNDADGKDCGEVWIDEQFLSLRFACHACLRSDEEAPQGSQAEPPVGQSH